MRNQPFGRAIAMMAAIQAAMALPVVAQQARLTEIGTYKSRGKGQNMPNRKAPGAGMAAHRAAMKHRNVMKHRKSCRSA